MRPLSRRNVSITAHKLLRVLSNTPPVCAGRGAGGHGDVLLPVAGPRLPQGWARGGTLRARLRCRERLRAPQGRQGEMGDSRKDDTQHKIFASIHDLILRNNVCCCCCTLQLSVSACDVSEVLSWHFTVYQTASSTPLHAPLVLYPHNIFSNELLLASLVSLPFSKYCFCPKTFLTSL